MNNNALRKWITGKSISAVTNGLVVMNSAFCVQTARALTRVSAFLIRT